MNIKWSSGMGQLVINLYWVQTPKCKNQNSYSQNLA